MAEAGYPGVEVLIWIGMFAPKGTPAALVEKINAAMVAAQQQPALIKALADAAVNVRSTTPEAFTSYVAEQYGRWNKLSKEIHLQVE